MLHPRQQVEQSAGFDGAAWVRWGSFSVYGVSCTFVHRQRGVPVSYELTPANVAEMRLTEELLAEASLGEEVGRRSLGDLAGLPERGAGGGGTGRVRGRAGDREGRPTWPERGNGWRSAFRASSGCLASGRR